jgi:group II intron reverse transcriptase/maturase
MNVTNEEIKYRKLHNGIDGGYLQMVSAERKEYAEAYASSKITENNIINTDLSTDRLLEKILAKDNLYQAYEKVKSNKGAGGVDKMGVEELLPYLKENQRQLFQSIKDGKYRPNPVRRVEIPKDNGKMRNLGIPTVVDRVIQQAISQVLTPIFEKQFSDNSYGFRPKRSAHDAMKKCIENTNDGFSYVVDMDLEKYFDIVNQSKLIEILSRTIKDGRVISLIHKYLKAGVVINHTFKETGVGVPQGGPLSPLLSNIMLNELDQELERRGHRFVRYADYTEIKTMPMFPKKYRFFQVLQKKLSA